ncbi:GGDEF domain-containing protein, partial [bacterium]|nr:GGDEF domain-containing protein [bacterium]
YNLWIPVVIPIISAVMAFALSFLAKYLIKSRDFEYQYKLATIDGLTELYNHRYFQDQMRRQIANSQRYNSEFSMIIVDIDHFKSFNDTYGHQAGDAVLRQVAQTLKSNSRATDIVCRYGGEEMSIILTNTGKEEALIKAHNICNAVANRVFKLSATQTVNVTISVGVSTFPENGETPQQIIEIADQGLYYAKEHGRNQVGLAEYNDNPPA